MRSFLCFVSLSLTLGCAILGASVPARAAAASVPAAEVADALARLHATSYRQRDIMTGSFVPVGVVLVPTVTEHVGGRTRLISEIAVPSLGTIRTEKITVGKQSAVRTTAPALVAKLEQTKSTLSVSAAKNLLQQIISAASAVQTGGLSTASWIAEASRAAVTLKTTADARAALDRALAGFQSWQRVTEDEDGLPDGPDPDELTDDMTVEKKLNAAATQIIYRRVPAAAASMGVSSVLFVDVKTGLPVAEEHFVGGQRMMRSEFFDLGAPINIESPAVLTQP
jgi:hypothetical protein